MIMASRRPESLVYLLQDEIIFFIVSHPPSATTLIVHCQ